MVRTLELAGVFTAIVTPFTTDGKVDVPALENLVESQIAGGVSGIVPVGTTGECPTLDKEEQKLVVSTCVAKANKRCKVIAGSGSNNTADAVIKTQMMKDCGVDAVLVVNPYYNKPGQKGLYLHFAELAKVGVPMVLYNIPGRTNITMQPATVAKLYNDFEEVVAIKEATGSLDIATEIASLCDITILSGDDSLTLPLISIGGKGVISVLSNFAPNLVCDIVNPALAGEFDKARVAHKKVFKFIKALFCEANPQPCKAVMKMMGMCENTCRLPLTSDMEPENIATLKALAEEFKLI